MSKKSFFLFQTFAIDKKLSLAFGYEKFIFM